MPSFIGTAGDGRGTTSAPLRQAVHVAGGHQVGAVAGEADDLGEHRRAAPSARLADLADRADRHADARGLEHQAGDADQPALRLERQRLGGDALQVGEVAPPLRRGRCAAGVVGARSSRRSRLASRRSSGVGRRLPRHRRCRAPRRHGASASSMRRVDQADVGFDAAAAARDRRRRRRRRAPRAGDRLGRRRRRPARGRRDGRAATMWRALSSSASSASLRRPRATQLGARRELAAQTWRASAGAVAASASRHLLLQRVELLADRAARSAPTCVVVWLREALLEAFERDQAVAVAVLVADLARRAQLRRCCSAGSTGARRSRPRGRAGAAPAPTGRRATRRRTSSSSSRGMKRRVARPCAGAPARRGACAAGLDERHRRCRRRSRSGLRRPGGARSSASPSARPRPRTTRTGPRDSSSSRSVSAARVDMFLKILLAQLGLGALQRDDQRFGLHFLQQRLDAACRRRSIRSSKVNMLSMICCARSLSASRM